MIAARLFPCRLATRCGVKCKYDSGLALYDGAYRLGLLDKSSDLAAFRCERFLCDGTPVSMNIRAPNQTAFLKFMQVVLASQ
jgi:hypothetical protein